jgi:hypothetical protein
MRRRQRLEALVSETAREIGVLMVVFVPLEFAFADRPVSQWSVGLAFLVGSILLIGGILLPLREENDRP